MNSQIKRLVILYFLLINLFPRSCAQSIQLRRRKKQLKNDSQEQEEITQLKQVEQKSIEFVKSQKYELNIANRFTKKQTNDHKGIQDKCIYNLNYLEESKRRILAEDIVSFQKDHQESNIIKQIDYQEYLKKFKPKQLIGINSQSDDFLYRLHIFKQNCHKIRQHNLQQHKFYFKGLNQFTDISDFEFSQLYTSALFSKPLTVIPSNKKQEKVTRNLQAFNNQKQPISLRYKAHIDWRCKCRQVYNQKSCNSCYAFAVIDSIQISLRILNNQKEYFLSTQQVISCSKAPFKIYGCDGGYPDDVYDYIKAKGIGSALLYPLNSQTIEQGQQTQCNQTLISSQKYQKSRFFIKGYKQIRRGDCEEIVRTLQTQIVIVSVYGDGLRDYQSGTFVSPYKNGQPEHGVTLVGYHPKHKYLIKNSWGPQWGMQGYAYVSESSGVCKYSFYPIL